MPPVHQHGQLHAGGPADVHERIERRAHGAPGEQHVVHQHDRGAVDVEGYFGGMDFRADVGGEVVAVEADVQLSERHLRALDLLDLVGQLLGQKVAPGDDSHDREPVCPLVRLEDLMSDARQRPLDLACIHADGLDRACVVHTHSLSFRVRTV